MKIAFISNETTVFSNYKIEVILNDKTYSCVFCESEADMVIDNYQLLPIEDGIYQLVFVHKASVYTVIIDLMEKEVVVTSIVNHEIVKQVGTICLDSVFMTNAEKAVDFWIRFFNDHDETAIDDYLAEPYLQHNPTVADGVEAFRNEFHPRFKGDMKDSSTIVKRVVSRKDLVFIHNILKRNPLVKGHAAVDIFRFENGKIVEHWDVIQKMPEISKNDHPMF